MMENVRSAQARASSTVTTIGCPSMAGYQRGFTILLIELQNCCVIVEQSDHLLDDLIPNQTLKH